MEAPQGVAYFVKKDGCPNGRPLVEAIEAFSGITLVPEKGWPFYTTLLR